MADTDSWSKGKQRHVELSDLAANEYDKIYGSSNFATGSYMMYELEVIDRAIGLLDKNCRQIALDLGCGTGRDSFHIHKHFAQVRGYDFSPGMIKVAQEKKLHRNAGNVQFVIRDIEEDYLSDIPNSTVALVNTGFGMGSFIQNFTLLLREVKRVLIPGGVFVVSFYNSESLVVQMDTMEWAPSLAARFDPTSGFLRVNFKNENFNLAVRAYSYKEVKSMLEPYFDVAELSTFPTLSSLFPNSIFSSNKVKELCTLVDKELKLNDQIAGGPYLVAICRKKGKLTPESELRGCLNIIRLLENNSITPNIKEHAPVSTPDDVSKVLGVEKEELIKSIIVRVNPVDIKNLADARPQYYALALQSNRKVDFAKLAHILAVKRTQIEIVNAYELEDVTGFSIGGIPPFGYPISINVILDARIKNMNMVYCGTGKRTESLRLSVDELIKLSSPVIAYFSKE